MEKNVLEMLEELRPEFDFSDSDDFVMDGYLDSFDIISLTDMIQEKYDVKIDGLDIVPENFSSVTAIIELVKKSGGKAE